MWDLETTGYDFATAEHARCFRDHALALQLRCNPPRQLKSGRWVVYALVSEEDKEKLSRAKQELDDQGGIQMEILL